ncbi:MAG: serine/threonine-protein kinase [Chloroflexota bacterium]
MLNNLRPKQRLNNNRYEIIRPLGQGGFGTVYLATDLRLNKHVAIKENVDDSPNVTLRFRLEAAFLADLNHDNLPDVTDYFYEESQELNGRQYLVMTFIEGRSLQEIIEQEGPQTEEVVIGWIKQVMDALSYMHSQKDPDTGQPKPVIHRDIKPANIRLRPSGRIYLVDFGLAKQKVWNRGDGYSTRTLPNGTRGYASPEQYTGGTNERADIYSLGATLYYLLTGQVPLDAESRQKGYELKDPTSLNPKISERCQKAILQAMRIKNEERYLSVHVFRQALITDSVEPKVDTVSHNKGRRLFQSLAIGLLLIFIGICAGWLFRDFPSFYKRMELDGFLIPSVWPSTAEPEATKDVTDTHIPLETTSDKTMALSSTRFSTNITVITSSATLQSPTLDVTRQISSINSLPTTVIRTPSDIITTGIQFIQTYRGHKSDILSVSWSKDGKQLASGSRDNTIRVWDVVSGELLNIFEGHTNDVFSISWSKDSSKFVSSSYQEAIVWDSTTGEQIQILNGHVDWVRSVDWSMAEAQIASGGYDNDIRIWDSTTGQLLNVLEGHMGWVRDVSWSNDGTMLASGSYDDTVRVWDGHNGKLIHILDGHTSDILNVAWAEDGFRLISSSYNETYIWDGNTGTLLNTMMKPSGTVWSTIFSTSLSLIASGSSDRTVRVWDGKNGQLLRILDGHIRDVNSVSWSPNGKSLASGSDDATIRVWFFNE